MQILIKAMEKTNNYFVISNYNYDPRHLLEYCDNYIICDQSIEQKYNDILAGTNFVKSKHTGHNISDYFSFFIEHYDNLPECIALIKGNIFPRHLSKEFFDKVYKNKFYTFLFENQKYRTNKSRAYFLFSKNEYLEYNNSWFVKEHPHWYFQKYNEILSFIYKNPIWPRYNLYSPGACYIVTKHQVLKNSKQFYKNILKLISYTDPVNPFPSEAHQIEWLCHTIYTSNYEIQEYMNSDIDFDAALIELCEHKKASRKVLNFMLEGEYAVRDGDANGQFIKASLASFKAIQVAVAPKILIIGVHSWNELECWGKAFPHASVLGTGILELPTRKDNPISLKYIQTSLSRLSEVPSIKSGEFDLIVYEGFHLKLDIEILSDLRESHLKVGGEIFVFDILSIPTCIINRISETNASFGAIYIAKCIPMHYDNIAGKYFVIVKKCKWNLLRSARFLIHNKIQALYYGLHWVRRNLFEYLKRKLPA